MTRHDSPDAARRRFFAAATEICAKQGFHATRMEDIAKHAGRSKGALYHHFPTKKVLFVELVHDIVDAFSAQVNEGTLSTRSARELLMQALLGLVESFGGLDVFRVFVEIMPHAARDPELRVPLARYYAQGIDAMATLLAYGQRRGELRPDFDPHRVARVLALGGDGIFMISTALGESVTAVDDVRELFVRVFDGLVVAGSSA